MRIDQQLTRCCLFVFAHPDDEFGCFESIYRCVEEGLHVVCVYLTDGGYAGQSIETREAESVAVLSGLGVAIDEIKFVGARVGIKDGALHENMEVAARELAGVLRRLTVPQSVYVPAWEGGHADHDCAHAVTVAVCRRLGFVDKMWQYSLYNGNNVRKPFFRVLSPLMENGTCVVQHMPLLRRLRYIKYCLSYPSQWKTWIGLFPFVLFKLLLIGRYEIQRVDAGRLAFRPHDGELLYERRGPIGYKDVEAVIAGLCRLYGLHSDQA